MDGIFLLTETMLRAQQKLFQLSDRQHHKMPENRKMLRNCHDIEVMQCKIQNILPQFPLDISARVRDQ